MLYEQNVSKAAWERDKPKTFSHIAPRIIVKLPKN
jgi:hypothetical protein